MIKSAYKQYGDFYVLKMDISKFFYSIDKNVLYVLLSKKIKDDTLLKLTKTLIYSDNEKVGIPIGNYTSQYFANIYMNELDHFIKDKIGIKYYIRYIDDFILFTKTKAEAIVLFNVINSYLNNQLKLNLNPKSKYYPIKLEIDFCGYIIFPFHKLVRKRSIIQMKKKINTELNKDKLLVSYKSWINHVKNGSTYNLKNKMNKNISKTLLK